MAATYGSVSAEIFITAVQYLDSHGVVYGGHMAAAMALMESPVILLAVALANRVWQRALRVSTHAPEVTNRLTVAETPLGHIIRESLTRAPRGGCSVRC